jgi:(1->4)-alpha-D-glucan 1-alpha-D-glucosylmutase
MTRPRADAPSSTYRLQLGRSLDFAGVAALGDYLADLGVSHVYLSPSLQAAPGSEHGYDVVDHRRANDELGGTAAHLEMCHRLRELGLGHVLDIVPNHMAVDPANEWWWDVLEDGPASRYARYFDVDWEGPEPHLHNLVVVPVLADHYGRMLEAGAIQVERADAHFLVRYEEHILPLAPRSLDAILAPAAARIDDVELAFLADSFAALPPASSSNPVDLARRHRDKRILAEWLRVRLERNPRAGEAIDETVRAINHDPDQLHALLERQNYRLTRWQLAAHQLDYRRFFDVTGLIAIRAEDSSVFSDTHELVFSWLRSGLLDGLRVDHVDGLRDPRGYLDRLADATGDTWIVVEKILAADEFLADWPTAGTTGYEFAADVTALLVDPAGERPLTDFYRDFTGVRASFAEIAAESKRTVLSRVLASDVARLTNQFMRVCERQRDHRDHSRQELARALEEMLVAFPVYRTYARLGCDRATEVSAQDRAVIARAQAEVAGSAGDVDPALLDFLGAILRLEVDDTAAYELSARFQQLSGPVVAKGMEDTAFYRYNRFVALNDVGGDPGRFSIDIDTFHRMNADAAARWPARMVNTSTHDSKRSEDVRARLAVISEHAHEWIAAVTRWSEITVPYRNRELLDRNTEYLLYQSLVGAHPISVERIGAFALKAVREAKVHTSWIAPDAAYEHAVTTFVESAMANEGFMTDLAGFARMILPAGRRNSLLQTVLRLTAPGVPDTYQGTELWDLSLVDPDNRRPVDYAARRQALERSQKGELASVLEHWDVGEPKLWVLHRALRARRHAPGAFGATGGYDPRWAEGPRRDHVVAFARGADFVTIGSRHTARLGNDWDGTFLDVGRGPWVDVFTDRRHTGPKLAVRDVLGPLPVALLARESAL